VTSDDACLDIFQKELDYVFRTLRRLGTSSSDVEDLAQEVFLALRRSWREYDQDRPIRPYLFGIAFRIAAAHQRKRNREVAVLVMHDLDDVSVSEVASVLAIPLFTAYSRLRKARRELEAAVRRMLREADAR
jgi:RNA polymerase sigma-70 factor (ECF subfamily)